MLIKRQQLLEEVWEERGLKGTNSNLNNYISLLRRHLAQLGETELIITYPDKALSSLQKISRHATAEPEKEQNIMEETAVPTQPPGQAAPEAVVAENYYRPGGSFRVGINGLISSYSSASLH